MTKKSIALIGAILFAGLLTACGVADADTEDIPVTTITNAAPAPDLDSIAASLGPDYNYDKYYASKPELDRMVGDFGPIMCRQFELGVTVPEIVLQHQGLSGDPVGHPAVDQYLILIVQVASERCPEYWEDVTGQVDYYYPVNVAAVQHFLSQLNES